MAKDAIDRILDLITVTREASDQKRRGLADTVSQAVAGMDRATQNIERSAQRMEQSAQTMSATADRIEAQVASMSEHLTIIDIKLERLIDATDRNAAAIAAQHKVAMKNADTIAGFSATAAR